MAPTTYEDVEESNCENMVSNLPLLFAGGYPTSLDKITESQLEKFIPFMVQCSLGYIQINRMDCTEPEWWPEDIEFLAPFRKPDNFFGDWHSKMKELVVICYQFHKSIFLLRFCNTLAEYEHETLRFINNDNSTTSLYHRVTNKLLVTFRNENMMYDAQPVHQRKSLLPKSPSAYAALEKPQMVEPAFFDIYLCDNCDAELYSLDAYEEHEKICVAETMEEDDDVIFIDETDDSAPYMSTGGGQPEFLSNFNLCSSNISFGQLQASNHSRKSYPHIGDYFGSPEKLRRLPNRSRSVIALSKCATIPLSSPCGQLLLKQSKTIMSEDYQIERIDRSERFCAAPPLAHGNERSRMLILNSMLNTKQRHGICSNVTYRRPVEQEHSHYHVYKFPRRQLSTKHRRAHFNFLHELWLKSCKPLSVKLKRLSDTDIEICKAKLRQAAQKVSFEVPTKQHVVEYIDLCSSDEGEGDIEFDENHAADHSEVINVNNNSNSEIVVDENEIRQKVDGILMSMPISANRSNLLMQPLTAAPVQPLRPSVFLFSNYQQYTNNPTSTSTPAASSYPNHFSSNSYPQEDFRTSKTNSINEWLNSTQNSMHLEHRNSTGSIRKMPGLVNIQQYTTTTIRQTITTANIAT